MPAGKKPPAFKVRFASFDDFLVEYGDHLRRGVTVLPLTEDLPVGMQVRIKMILPDDGVLYLSGSVQGQSIEETDGAGGIRIRLQALSAEQKAVLDQCVARAARQGVDEVVDGYDDGDPINLLLVDDSVSIRIELGDALRERGIRVRVAENGLVAIAAALKRPPDVILCDVEMPTMDGWTFLRMARARKRLASIPVVFFTRLTDDLSRLQGYRMGVEDYLAKDTVPDEIVTRLKAVLARHNRAMQTDITQGLRGDLQHVRLGSLLSFLEQERRDGALHLTNGRDAAVVTMQDGRVMGVDDLGRFSRTEDRMFELLDWAGGEFEFVPADGHEDAGMDTRVAAGSEPISVTYVLMEHARRTDEAANG